MANQRNPYSHGEETVLLVLGGLRGERSIKRAAEFLPNVTFCLNQGALAILLSCTVIISWFFVRLMVFFTVQ